MIDKIYNYYLLIKNFFMFILKIKLDTVISGENLQNKVSHFFDSKDYTMDDLKNDYHLRPTSALYNKKNLNQWFDIHAVNLSPKGLELSITDHILEDNDTIIPNGTGRIISKNSYSYGIFEWNIILPKGKQLWPAIWLTHADTWPPEIDVIEAYSNNDSFYNNKLNSNVYYGNSEENNKQIMAMSHGFLINENGLINLKLHWTKEFIRIYYNNYLVRQITNKKVLKSFNDNPIMKVIMNNGIRKSSTFKQMSTSPLIIKNFYYTN